MTDKSELEILFETWFFSAGYNENEKDNVKQIFLAGVESQIKHLENLSGDELK